MLCASVTIHIVMQLQTRNAHLKFHSAYPSQNCYISFVSLSHWWHPPVNQPSHPHNSTPSSIWTPWCNSIGFSHVVLDSHEYMAATLSRRVKSIRRVWGWGLEWGCRSGRVLIPVRPVDPYWACPGGKAPVSTLESVTSDRTMKLMGNKPQYHTMKTYGEVVSGCLHVSLVLPLWNRGR